MRSTIFCFLSRGLAPDQVPLDAVYLIRSAFEGGSEAAECRVEHCAHEHAKGAAAEFIGYEKFDFARALTLGPKGPAIVHFLERAFEIFNQDFKLLRIERDATGKGFADKFVGNGHIGDDDIPPRAVLG